MLSIAAMSPGQERYYSELAREDYYIGGGEPPGRWLGQGAAALELSGEVEAEALRNLFRGLSPDGSQPLGQLQQYRGGRERQPGWDLTFSAPKSVSALWSLVSETTREAIEGAHNRAVEAAVSYLEQDAGHARRGRGGERIERAELVVAAFEHGTSRAQDPHLHTHALFLNIGRRVDGSFGTIRSLDLYQHKMAAGALYRAELAHQLGQALGFSFSPLRGWFEVRGVPKELMEAFSTRRTEIEQALATEGLAGPRASELAALTTRQRKGHASRDVLVDAWRATGAELGFSTHKADGLVRECKELNERATRRALGQAIEGALSDITEHEAYFRERDLVRGVAEKVLAKGISAQEIVKAVSTAIDEHASVLTLSEETGYKVLTTREMYALEESLFELAEELRGNVAHVVEASHVEEALAVRPTIRIDQAEAVRHVTLAPGSIQCVEGLPGTGKTFMLEAAREAWEAAGYHARGFALSARAARELEQGSGISSGTIARALIDIEKDRLWLTPSSIVVIDEAGMVGTRQMQELLGAAQKAGAKVILVGDSRQLQPIEAGGPFRALSERLGSVELTEITRQFEEWMRDAVRQFANGDARAALTQYALAERLHIEPTRLAAMEKLIMDWSEQRTELLEDTLILAGTKADAAALNQLAQAARHEKGELEGSVSPARGAGESFFVGDRVLVTKNNRCLGVVNGDRGTVESIERGLLGPRITVRLDGAESRVVFGRGDMALLTLGYASTTHKAQGATVRRTFVLGGGWMQDRELSTVQMSRARELTRLYVSEAEAGEDLDELVRAMERSRQSEMALAIAQREEERLQQAAMARLVQ